MQTITVTQNVFGDLHIFEGDQWVNRNNPANHLSEDGEPARVYLQGDEINNFFENSGISSEGVEMLSLGYVVTIDVTPDYSYSLFSGE